MRVKSIAIIALLGSFSFGQSNPAPVSSSSAIQSQEIAALCPQGHVTDVLLMGTASWTMGSDNQSGQAVLKARASGQSRVDLSLGNGVRSEIRINDPLNPQYTTLEVGKWSTRAIHNSWVDANWFFPALSALTVGPQNGFVLGSISDSSHLFAQLQLSNQAPRIIGELQRLSVVLYDIDPSTKLPTRDVIRLRSSVPFPCVGSMAQLHRTWV